MHFKNKLILGLATSLLTITGSVNATTIDSVEFENSIEKLRQVADSCLLVKDADPFSQKVGNCYANTHSKVKQKLNDTIQLMSPADKVQYLNTSGAYAQLQKKHCDKMYPESLHKIFSNQISECKLKIDLGQALIVADKYL